MRSVQVVNHDTEAVTRAEHMIGFDESGSITQDDVFVLTAFRSPREYSEQLAEFLIECELKPWRAKSSELVEHTSENERDRRVADLINDLENVPIHWSAAISYSSTSIAHKAAALCILSQKTITRIDCYTGDAVIVPDGDKNMYGSNQEVLRQQAAQMFGGSFRSKFGEMYISALPKADLTYPEVTAADYIAAYLRSQIQSGVTIQELPDTVLRFDQNWREPTASPFLFYRLRKAAGDYGLPERKRVVAWLKGRHPDGYPYDASRQYENAVETLLRSQVVKEYLLEM